MRDKKLTVDAEMNGDEAVEELEAIHDAAVEAREAIERLDGAMANLGTPTETAVDRVESGSQAHEIRVEIPIDEQSADNAMEEKMAELARDIRSRRSWR